MATTTAMGCRCSPNTRPSLYPCNGLGSYRHMPKMERIFQILKKDPCTPLMWIQIHSGYRYHRYSRCPPTDAGTDLFFGKQLLQIQLATDTNASAPPQPTHVHAVTPQLPPASARSDAASAAPHPPPPPPPPPGGCGGGHRVAAVAAVADAGRRMRASCSGGAGRGGSAGSRALPGLLRCCGCHRYSVRGHACNQADDEK